MQIQVTSPAGLHHHASGFHAWTPGDYDFPDDPRYAGWLVGHFERGNARLVIEPVGGEEAAEAQYLERFDALMDAAEAAVAATPLLDAGGDAINDPADVLPAIKCTGRTKQRKACNRWALEGSDRCADHPKE